MVTLIFVYLVWSPGSLVCFIKWFFISNFNLFNIVKLKVKTDPRVYYIKTRTPIHNSNYLYMSNHLKHTINDNENSDEVSTDTRSSPISSSSIPLCSFDKSELNQEADKQILEWASKLELETIQLRDKSEVLIDILNKKRGELTQCVTRLDTLLQRQNEETTSKITAQIKKSNESQDSHLNGMSSVNNNLPHFINLTNNFF